MVVTLNCLIVVMFKLGIQIVYRKSMFSKLPFIYRYTCWHNIIYLVNKRIVTPLNFSSTVSVMDVSSYVSINLVKIENFNMLVNKHEIFV